MLSISPPAKYQKCAHLGMVLILGSVDHPKHWNHAYLGMFSIFSICRPLPPAEHWNCAQIGMVSTLGKCRSSWTLKLCLSGHVFDAWHLSTTSPPLNTLSGHGFNAWHVFTASLPAIHQNYAHLCMFSMLSACPLHPY